MNEIIYLSAGNGQFVEAERVEGARAEVRASLYVGAEFVAAFVGDSESQVVADALAWIALAEGMCEIGNYSLTIEHVTVENYILIAPENLLAAPAAEAE